VIAEFWNWFNTIASTPAGIGALATLVGAILQFSRVFLERHSNKLVARDNKRREARQAALSAVIQGIETWFRQFDELGQAARNVRRYSRPAPYLDEAARPELLRQAVVDFGIACEEFGDRTRPLIASYGLYHRFPLLGQVGRSLSLFTSGLAMVSKAHGGIKSAHYIDEGDAERRRLFEQYHRAIEYLLFGTSSTWAGCMFIRRRLYAAGWRDRLKRIKRWRGRLSHGTARSASG
jgi:hypothetical protein